MVLQVMAKQLRLDDPTGKSSKGRSVLQMISRKPCEINRGQQPPSLAMQAKALLALAWPKTHVKFERDWRKASSVAAKHYETPSLTRVDALWIPVDSVLEKNREENEVYLEVLRANGAHLEQTRYIQDIQIGNHGRTLASALAKAEAFRLLARSVEREGIRRPVFLADVAEFDLPYRMFRFDGHHRAICAKYLGMDLVPAFVFKVTPPVVSRH